MKWLLLSLAFFAHTARAAGPSPSLAGTWVLAAADVIKPDGTRTQDYGTSPHGLLVLTTDGRYSVQIYRAERTKFSSGDKRHGSPEEYKDASLGMSCHFGTYSVDPEKMTITFSIDRSSFPNWDNTVQIRRFQLHEDELSWKVAPRPDGSVPVSVFRRLR